MAGLRPRYTFAEYVELERRSSEVKHEYVAGEIFAMAGGSVEHSALASALLGLVFGQLRRTPVERDAESPNHVTNPRVVVEVLSPSSERYDREQKRLYYQQLDSLREYGLVAQDRRHVEVWRREGEGWIFAAHESGGRVALPSIAVAFEVDELYDAAGLGLR